MKSMTTRIASLASALALALGGTLLFAAPANAADVDPAPINTIAGSNVNVFWGEDIAVAADGTLYVSVHDTGEVLVYAPGATHNANPEFVITGLNHPAGVALDDVGNLWVADEGGGINAGSALLEFAEGANANATPIRDIEGTTSGVSKPEGIAFDGAGNLYVANAPDTGAGVLEFLPNSNGDARPIRTITGPRTGLSLPNGSPFGIAISPDGSIVVSTPASHPSAVAVFASGADGNVVPRQRIIGPRTELNGNFGVAVDLAGRIYASNSEDESAGSGSQTVYAANANGNVAPLSRLKGAATGLSNPYMNVLDDHGHLWVVNNGDGKAGPSSITEYAALPAVTRVSLPTGSPAGGETVTLSGFYFAADATVTFGGVAATSVVVNSSTSITAVVPAHVAGKVDVVVSQDKGTSSTTATGAYTYGQTAALPTTGVDAGSALGVGALLLLLGAVLLRARRRSQFTNPRGAPGP